MELYNNTMHGIAFSDIAVMNHALTTNTLLKLTGEAYYIAAVRRCG